MNLDISYKVEIKNNQSGRFCLFAWSGILLTFSFLSAIANYFYLELKCR